MISTLERFRIVGLHGHRTLDVPICENTLVLVGENGSGKTTFLRILFHFLSGRWHALANFRFDSIIATIGGQDYFVSHEQVATTFKGIEHRFLSELPPPLRRRLIELIERGELERATYELDRYGHYGPPELVIRQLQLNLFETSPGIKKEAQELIAKIRAAIGAQILYLPTYRRIERELSSIFEGVDPDDTRHKKYRPRQSESEDAYIELVEFGMKDVQQAVDRTTDRLKEYARDNLNTLTLKYLGDVVNREYENVGMDDMSDVSEETVRAVLDRIHESILTTGHKEHLFQVINSARYNHTPNEHERIMSHYFLKLLRFQQSLREHEQSILAFCALCSEYIKDKRFVYDSQTFTFSIVPTEELHTDRAITLGDLSSGEKQIVSLFSHLYLSGRQDFFVIIDEPELSLSVPWQRRFLSDIRKGQFCKGLIAATHSPFTYENELHIYTHSLGEFFEGLAF